MILNSNKISFLLIAGLSNDFVDLMVDDYNSKAQINKRIYNCDINSEFLKDFFKNNLINNGLELEIKESIERITSYQLSNFFTIVYGDDNIEILNKFYVFLKLIKPSSIFINSVFFAIKEDDKFVINNLENHRNISYQNIIKDPFTTDMGFVDLANLNSNLADFIIQEQSGLLQKIIDLYLEANNSEKNYVKIILYISVLEMLNNNSGKDSITLKVSRLPAVLLGFDIPTSEMIYKNMVKIYDIRSKMVHQAKFEEATKEIANYLSQLISSIFLTLLKLNELNIDKLFSVVNHFGFGQRDMIFIKYSTSHKIHLSHKKEYFLKDLFLKEE